MDKFYKIVCFLAGLILLACSTTVIKMAWAGEFHELPIFPVMVIFATAVGAYELLWGGQRKCN